MWTGMGVRVLMVNPAETRPRFPVPHQLNDLERPAARDQIGISNPQFGTASDWAAALAVRQGVPKHWISFAR